jgi:CRISPR-associated protein Cas1
MLAKQYGIVWNGRRYNPKDWAQGDIINQCISTATSCLYGITEAAVLAAGYAPAIGFVHSGKPLSFVYDIADLIKFDGIIQIAFQVASQNPDYADRTVRLSCRDYFRQKKVLSKIIPMIEEVLSSGGIEKPQPAKEAMPPAIPNPTSTGEVGHRSG